MGEDCHLDDDGGPEVYAVEATDGYCHRQSLHIRVGPVFHGGEEAAEPGVWVEYQEEHLKCLPAGPVLLTPEVWRELNKAVEARLGRKGYGKWRTRLHGVMRRMSSTMRS
jgi:hypothetical protein